MKIQIIKNNIQKEKLITQKLMKKVIKIIIIILEIMKMKFWNKHIDIKFLMKIDVVMATTIEIQKVKQMIVLKKKLIH